jgi:hypothetical protein
MVSKLKDIKPNIAVPDESFVLFLLVLFCVLVFVLVVGYFVYKTLKSKKKKKYEFDLRNPKKTAYTIIELIRDLPQSEEYIERLRAWTYKKEVPPFDEKLFKEIKEKFNLP